MVARNYIPPAQGSIATCSCPQEIRNSPYPLSKAEQSRESGVLNQQHPILLYKPDPMNHSAAFFEAIQSGNLAEMQSLLAAQPGLALTKSPQGLSPLMLALYHRQGEVVAILLAQGVPLNWYEAASVGAIPRMESLLTVQPALLHQAASDGFSALGLACFFGQEKAVNFLLEQGAKVNQASENSFQVRPIHSSVAAGNLPITLALLQAGADPNAAQMQGVRPLHSAAHQGNLEMVELLLAHGADATLATEEGKTALDFAREDGHEAVAGRLES